MRREFNNAVSVVHSAVRFALLRLVCGDRVKVSGMQRFSPNVVVEVNKGGKLTLGRSVRVHSGSKIKVRWQGEISIGSGAKINYGCIFISKKRIEIGQGTEFGPSVFIFDHDHDFRKGLKANRFKAAPVVIGKNCWIGANTVILRGTTIGDNCVIGAGSVVKGEIPANTVFVQRRENLITPYEETT